MNILYLNHYFGGPAYGMEFRTYYLAREWVRAGHRVAVAGGSYSHVRSVQPKAPVQPEPRRWEEATDGIEINWYRVPRYVGNGVDRAWNIAVFLSRVAVDATRLVRKFRPDVVIASSTYPMDIWVARRIARMAGARLVFELHDLWPLSPIELGGMSPRHPFAQLCRVAEKSAYRDADAVISMLPNVKAYLDGQGLSPRRLAVVPNGISPEEWASPGEVLREDVAAFIAEQRLSGRLVVGYAGSHGLPNALDVLIDAADLLRDVPLAFVVVGDGMEKGNLAERLARSGNDRMRMFRPVPKAQIPALLSNIDIAYIGWRRNPIYRFGIAPNKLLDYMMAGRVILHSVDAGNDPVGDAGCGLTVAPESPGAVADGLRQLAALPDGVRREKGQRGREYVLAHHAYPVLAQRFIEAIGS